MAVWPTARTHLTKDETPPPRLAPDLDLAEVQPYPGPQACFDADTGTIWIGRHGDGALAPWQLYRPGWGACGGVVVGGTGSGTSTLLDTLGYTAAHTGLASVWAADPQGGASLPGAFSYAHWHAGDDTEILRMLRAAYQAADRRLAANATCRRTTHPITPQTPVVLLLVDDCQQVFTPRGEATWLATRIARTTRQTGVAIAAAPPSPELRWFGNDEALRSCLTAGNTVALHTTSAATRALLPGVERDPSTLPPRLPGVGLVAFARPDPFRGWYRDDADPQAWDAPDTPVEPLVTHALGETYTGRAERREARVAALRASLHGWDGPPVDDQPS